jgi:Coenzyme PQQ synthesis protein D (PqqD)
VNKHPLNNLPKARKDKLIIKELPDETLVYDLESDKAHCLNATAARVWKHCDGNRTITELTALLAAGTKSTVPDEVVWLALDQLEKFDLLEDTPEIPLQFAGMNRRQLVRRIGIGVLALPLIVSITTSTAQAQGSLLAPGRCCVNKFDCASNGCSQTPTCISPPPVAPSTKSCD